MAVLFENMIHFVFQTVFGTRAFIFVFVNQKIINEILASNLMEALIVKFIQFIKYCKVFLVILNGRL